ncbi:hypothetical protein Tco_0500101 [Tanacetum coccineum]
MEVKQYHMDFVTSFLSRTSYHTSIKAAPFEALSVKSVNLPVTGLRYVRPFKVLAKVGAVSYKLELPQELSRVHNTFHVSNLKKFYADEPLAIPLDGLHFDDKLQFVEEPVEIMDREVKRTNKAVFQSSRFDGTLGEILEKWCLRSGNGGKSVVVHGGEWW